jgi:prepilin-type N-terminal cleavage/methylation domain-containing protein
MGEGMEGGMNETGRQGEAGRRMGGFTLVELLVVIGILALIATALLRNVIGANESANIAATTSLIAQLEQIGSRYETVKWIGDYPPDDFKDTSRKNLRIKRDSTNPGIESFLIFINRRGGRTEFLDENFFCNTDGDSTGKTLGKLETNKKYEIKDAWGNPLVYFHKRHYGESQQYLTGGEDEGPSEDVQTVQAWKNAEGSYFRRGKFQIFSAGPDGLYNTEDDVASFPIPREQ